jgi:hypothetical protein
MTTVAALLAGLISLLCAPAWAQSTATVLLPSGCGTGNITNGVPYLTVDSQGRLCNNSSAPSGTQDVAILPTSASASGIALGVSAAAESSHVLKASAGNLYSLTITIGATGGYLMLFDATSLPANGAVTPKYCFPIATNGTNGGIALSWLPGPPVVFATGITAGFSTTGCFTLTASATAAFFGQAQ